MLLLNEAVPTELGVQSREKILNVNREAYLDKVINDLIPAILLKFPDLESAIKIQQYNACLHIHPDDPYFLNAAANQGLNLEMECQSPNSPDHNVCDLGFFRAIDSFQQEETANTLDELIQNVQTAFDEYSVHKLERVWLSHQHCMIKTMEERGSNHYKLPHMCKGVLAHQGLLPTALQVPIALVRETQALLAEHIFENGDSGEEE